MPIDNINYQGPRKDFRPELGHIVEDPRRVFQPFNPDEGYADIGWLLSALNELDTLTSSWGKECQEKLSKMALRIPLGSSLEAAQAKEYVTHLTSDATTPDFVDFYQYNYLKQGGFSTTSSLHIIEEYETKMRDITGSISLDILTILNAINKEVRYIREFLNQYLEDIDDASEFRTIEIFQDWCEEARIFATNLRSIHAQQIPAKADPSDLGAITEGQASQYQALLKGKVNEFVKLVRQGLNDLEKNWLGTSQIFYTKLLGPALRTQVGAIRHVDNVTRLPSLEKDLIEVISGMDANFAIILTDQIRRNKMFAKLIGQLIPNLIEKQQYIQTIKLLSAKGKPPPQLFVDANPSTEHIDAFSNIPTTDTILDVPVVTAPTFLATHSDLDDTDSDDAHPQYLLRAGGEITGNITVADGVTIDGVDISAHTHNGIDSALIDGSNITPGSLSATTVDETSDLLPTPTDVTIVSQATTTNGNGVTSTVVQLAWEMSSTSGITLYEFEITPIN